MNKKININDKKAWSELDWDDPVQPEALKKTDQGVAVARANRLTKTTKESIENQTKRNREQAKDPEWLAATRKAAQKKAKDPEWLAAVQKGTESRKAKGAQLKAEGKEKEFIKRHRTRHATKQKVESEKTGLIRRFIKWIY